MLLSAMVCTLHITDSQITPQSEDGKMVIEYERGSDEPALPMEGQTTIAKITLADCLACSYASLCALSNLGLADLIVVVSRALK